MVKVSSDPDKMITMLYGAVKDALDAGFAGLCAAGDMSWLPDEAEGSGAHRRIRGASQ